MTSSPPAPRVRPNSTSAPDHPPRRKFLIKFTALVAMASACLIPLSICVTYVLSPILRRKSGVENGDGFSMIGKVGGLVPGGPPQLFQVLGTKKDAWTTYDSKSLGSVFVSLKEDGSLQCLNARCPHLGCTVGFQPSVECYSCPCHTASFDLLGAPLNQVPPRKLDELNAEIRNGNEIWVKFVNYRTGTEQQIPV